MILTERGVGNLDGAQYWEGMRSRQPVRGQDPQTGSRGRGPVRGAQEPHQLAGLQGCHRSLGDSIPVRVTGIRLRIMTRRPHNCPRATPESQRLRTY